MRNRNKERSDPTKSLVGFIVGDIHYALTIGVVREIVNPGALTSLPHLPAAVAGVADHRGEVIVVVDLRARFGLGPAEDQSRSKWVLINVGPRAVGLIVDQVTEVFGTGGEQLRPAPTMGGGEDVRGIASVIARGGSLTFVLDVERFETITAAIPQEVFDSIAPREAR
jgi:purine-binding chemotaxis protein CheW